MKLAMSLLFALFAGMACAGEPSPAERDAAKLATALVARDYPAVADLTHPAVIKAAGGTDGVIKMLQDANAGLTVNSMKFHKPRHIRNVRGTLIAKFPFRTNATLDGKSVDFDSFYIGLSSDKQNWRFVDCEGVTQSYLRQLVPGYKDNLDLKGC